MNNNIFLYLSLGSYLGVSLRLHIIELIDQYILNDAIPKDIIDNFLGSFIIGFYNDKYKSKDFALHLAISTGFCGSLTTFSSWIIGNILLIQQNKLFDCFMNIFIGLCIAYSGFKLGQATDQQLLFPFHKQIYLLIILTTICFQIYYFKFNIIIAALLGPFGTILRYQLSKLNKTYFPFGTYIANLLAVIIGSIFVYLHNHQLINIQLFLFVIIKGFCGSLSTVSTWIKELCTILQIEQKLFYLWLSVFPTIYIGYTIQQI